MLVTMSMVVGVSLAAYRYLDLDSGMHWLLFLIAYEGAYFDQNDLRLY